MMTVAIVPVTRPLLQKALGIARIPVPKLPFSRWINVSVFLKRIIIFMKREARLNIFVIQRIMMVLRGRMWSVPVFMWIIFG